MLATLRSYISTEEAACRAPRSHSSSCVCVSCPIVRCDGQIQAQPDSFPIDPSLRSMQLPFFFLLSLSCIRLPSSSMTGDNRTSPLFQTLSVSADQHKASSYTQSLIDYLPEARVHLQVCEGAIFYFFFGLSVRIAGPLSGSEVRLDPFRPARFTSSQSDYSRHADGWRGKPSLHGNRIP